MNDIAHADKKIVFLLQKPCQMTLRTRTGTLACRFKIKDFKLQEQWWLVARGVWPSGMAWCRAERTEISQMIAHLTSKSY